MAQMGVKSIQFQVIFSNNLAKKSHRLLQHLQGVKLGLECGLIRKSEAAVVRGEAFNLFKVT